MAQMQQNDLMPAGLGSLLLAATFCSMVVTLSAARRTLDCHTSAPQTQ
jgi:CPA2 family monovalent cation:H+ antiporter-2